MSSHHLSIDDVSDCTVYSGHSADIIDEFFVRLAELFDSRQKADRGSVFLAQKRLTHVEGGKYSILQPDFDVSFPDTSLSAPLPVLIRATNGDSKDEIRSKLKLSTVVQPDQLENFYVRYAEACKSGMQGLKKRDRSRRKKATKAKKRKEIDGEKKA